MKEKIIYFRINIDGSYHIFVYITLSIMVTIMM